MNEELAVEASMERILLFHEAIQTHLSPAQRDFISRELRIVFEFGGVATIEQHLEHLDTLRKEVSEREETR
jgi:hypothetical protein